VRWIDSQTGHQCIFALIFHHSKCSLAAREIVTFSLFVQDNSAYNARAPADPPAVAPTRNPYRAP
jgi:hypothetical protein